MITADQGHGTANHILFYARSNRLALALVFALMVSQAARAQSFSVIYNFTGQADGATPTAGVTIDHAGNLYGTTPYGGLANGCEGCGAVYKLSQVGAGWQVTPLYNFKGPAQNDGSGPNAGVVFGPDGALYGTTSRGGASNDGTVFRMTPPLTICKTALCYWQETVLHNFTDVPDGNWPGPGSVTFDAAGNLYGTTVYGGEGNIVCITSCGTVYQLSRSGSSWTEDVIWDFPGFVGYWPSAGVLVDNTGRLFGVTTNPSGVVYELTSNGNGDWVATPLYDFSQQQIEYDPVGGLIMDAAGNLYGTTAGGGTGGGGTVFELVRNGNGWNFSVLWNFLYSGTENSPGPQGALLMDASGNLYGTTLFGGLSDCGTVFKLSPSGGSWNLTTLHNFTCGVDGGRPLSNVSADAAGNLYGTASVGGQNRSGVVWKIAS